MTDVLLDGLSGEGDIALPVMALADLAVRHTPAYMDAPPRIDILHRSRPDEPLISLDPADANTFMGRLSEQLAHAWVTADERRQRVEARHAARDDGDVS